MSAVISTHSQDVARGLDHPDSVRARRFRIAQAKIIEQERKANLNQAVRLIRENLSGNEDDLLLVLNNLSSAFAKHHGPESHLHPVVTALDKLADSIEFHVDLEDEGDEE